MIPFHFHPDARLEFIESVDYYETQRQGLGRRFVDAVEDAIHQIRSHPNMYPHKAQRYQQCRVPKFPYGLIYRIKDGIIEIIAVMNLHRRPGYWSERTKGN